MTEEEISNQSNSSDDGNQSQLNSTSSDLPPTVIPLDVATPDISTLTVTTPTETTPSETTPTENTSSETTPTNTPEPIVVDTPLLNEQQGSGTPSEENENLNGTITSSQDVIKHIAEHSVTALNSAATVTLQSSQKSSSSSNPDVDTTDDAEKIIAELIVNAPSQDVCDILRSYSTSNSYTKQLTIFNSNRCKKSDLIATLHYLGERNVAWKDELKNNCASQLIYRIQGLLPEECGVCKETYVVKIDDPRLLSCSNCGHEVHHKCYGPLFKKNDKGLSVVEAIKMVPGFHHLCPSCESDLLPDECVSSNAAAESQPPQATPLQQKQP